MKTTQQICEEILELINEEIRDRTGRQWDAVARRNAARIDAHEKSTPYDPSGKVTRRERRLYDIVGVLTKADNKERARKAVERSEYLEEPASELEYRKEILDKFSSDLRNTKLIKPSEKETSDENN